MNLVHRIDRRVYIEHTDQTGFLYHGKYLDFFQQGRTEWLRFYLKKSLADLSVFFIVHSIEIGYKKPLKLDQYFEVLTVLVKINQASWVFEQSIIYENKTFCLAKIKLACLDQNKKLIKIPFHLA